MSVNIFSDTYLSSLVLEAKASRRLRQHRNIHSSFDDNCQRLMNAICIGSYIAPHRHLLDPRNECLIAVRGLFAVIIFDNLGEIDKIEFFGTQEFKNVSVGLELASETWHTVIAMVENSVLFEVKEGPFDPNQAKEFPPWAPNENTIEADEYYSKLMLLCRQQLTKLIPVNN